MKNQLFSNILVTASFQIINQSAEFSKLWTDLKRINLTHFKIGSLLFTLRQSTILYYLVTMCTDILFEIKICALSKQNRFCLDPEIKSSSLKQSISTDHLFPSPIINEDSDETIRIINTTFQYNQFRFRSDVICDLNGKLRNWKKDQGFHFRDYIYSRGYQ